MSGPAMAGPTTEDAVPQEQSSDPELNDALTAIIAQRNVQTVFQPVIRIGSGEVVAFESLTRPPPGSPFRSPIHLFGAAIRHSVITDLELLCCELAIERFSELRLPGELLLNLSPRTVVEAQMGQYRTLDFLQHSGLDASQVVVEMTEYQRTPALGHLREALLLFRSFGMDVAIDDLGQGFSSLRLWSELRPDLVKIDMHFVQGIHADPVKLQFLRSVQQIADSCGARLIAEGIEETADLLVLRDLGISFGQGFLIAHPQASPSRESTQDILRSICSRGISVFPQDSLLPNSRKVTAEKLLIRATPVPPSAPTTNCWTVSTPPRTCTRCR
jgi:EAL domain-containing protein (putative c-di-GMP-specific phosphodiesterase class I)